MLTDNLDITFSVVWTVIIANVIGAAVLMVWGRQIARTAFVDGSFVVPAVIMFNFMGSWLWQPGMFSWFTLLGIGLLGYVMKIAGWPRPPFILGFVLGPIMENAMAITYQSYTPMEVVARPTVIALTLVVAVVFWLAWRATRKRLADFDIEVTTVSRTSLRLSSALALLVAVVFAVAIWLALPWHPLARVSPVAIASVGLLLMATVLLEDRTRLAEFAAARAAGDATAGGTFSGFAAEHRAQFATFLAIAAIVALTPVVGTFAAIVGFAAAYLAAAGGHRWWVTALYAAGIALTLHLLYDRILHTPSSLRSGAGDRAPARAKSFPGG
jgi:hypothetical protein